MQGRLHLLERLDHVFPLKDGSRLWASGYWELTVSERGTVKQVFLHRSKAEKSHWGGEVTDVVPALQFAAMAERHATDVTGRWVLIVKPDASARDVAWEGQRHAMAYKSLV